MPLLTLPEKQLARKLIIGLVLTVFLLSGFLAAFGASPRDASATSSHSTSSSNAKIVQGTGQSCYSDTSSCSIVATFANPVKSGDIVVVALELYPADSSPPTVTDSLSSSYSVAVHTDTTDAAGYEYIYLATLKVSGSDTLTITASSETGTAYIYEVSGVTTLLKGTSAGRGSCYDNSPTTCPISTSSSVAFKPGAFLLASMFSEDGAFSPGSGFTSGGGTEYSTSGVLSPTNFPATVTTPGLNVDPDYWVEVAVALQPKPSTTPIPIAGYLGNVSSGKEITYVTAKWNVAGVSCDKSLGEGQSLFTYLQIGDAKTSETIGTWASCSKGATSPTYSAFAVFTPTDTSIVIFSLAIKAGDEVSVTIGVSTSTDTVTAKITDLTTKASATHMEVVSGTSPFYSEWLVWNGGMALAKFSSAVKFQNCSATVSGKSISILQFAKIFKFTMIDSSKKTLAVASSLSSTGKAFSVVWKAYT